MTETRLNGKQRGLLQETLEHRILHGLSCEWETALWVLGKDMRAQLQKPLFRLRDMERRLGQWDLAKKEISLSRSFVMEHPWGAVREVLAHEIAHQVAHQVFFAANETAHGPAFQKACALLHIDAVATGRYQRLDESDTCGESDRILIRIKKLLALAESQNVHEAEAAMLKAHALIEKYNVDLLALNEHRDFVSILVGPPALRHTRDKYRLANLLQDFYFVEGIWVPVYVMDKGRMGRALEISGTAQNVALGSYVHDFISHYIASQWIQYKNGKRLSHHRQTDFAIGILDGFRKKLTTTVDKKRCNRHRGALVAIDDPQLQTYMAYRYPQVRNIRRSASTTDMNVIQAGIAVGERLVISKGITVKEKGRGRIGFDGLQTERKR